MNTAFGNRPRNRDSTGNGCRKCGQLGHFARECYENLDGFRSDGPNISGLTTNNDERHRGPITYIPAEASLELLWGQRINPGTYFERFFDINVQVSGDDTTLEPIKTFMEAGLTPLLLENVYKAGFTVPTPIQQYAIPYILQGRDMMGCAQTGSGKTAAFLLPILTSILNRSDMTTAFAYRQEPTAIVVTPTRELAIQIKDEGRKFAAGTMGRICVAYGGTNVKKQCEDLQPGCNILVATPGRLMQIIEEGKIGLTNCRYLVLDEADRMLDMGFEPTMRKLIGIPEMPGTRQTLLFSATFPPEIQQLAHDFLRRFVFLTVGRVGSANQDIRQTILNVPSNKYEKLYELLTTDLEQAVNRGSNEVSKILVFVERRRVADFVASRLSQMGLSATSIHGDREQREREEALRDFRSGRCPVLVATSVAARGLDIVGVDHVINFDLPKTVDDYVHRIGRTGRVGNPGRATSFFDLDTDQPMIVPLINVLTGAGQEIPEWFLALSDGAATTLENTVGDFGNIQQDEQW